MFKKLLFILIISTGIFLRLYQINSLPGGLFMDEVAIGVDAKTIAEHGTDQFGNAYPFFFENLTDYKMPVYIYFTALAYKVLGSQVITVRIGAILAGFGLLFTVGYLARILFSEKKYLAYYAIAVLALSPFAIHVGRIGYETTVATFFLSIFLIAFIKTLRNGRQLLWFIIGCISAVLSTWTYPVPRVIVPLFLVSLTILSQLIHFEHVQKKRLFFVSGGFFLVLLLSTVPLFILSPAANARAISYIGADAHQSGLSFIITKLSSIISSWIRLWNPEFLFDKGDLFAYRHGTKENGLFLSLFLLPYLVGLWYFIKRFRLRNFQIVFLSVFALVAGLPSALTSGVPYATRIVPMLIPYSLLLALGIDEVAIRLSTWKGYMRIMSSVVIGVLLVYQVALFAHIYFGHFAQTSLPEFPKAPVVLGHYIKDFQLSHPNESIYFLNDRTCHAWGHDELQFWYFANLPSEPMISWNNAYRRVRLKVKNEPSINVYDSVTIPSGKVGNIYLFPGNQKQNTPGLFVRCGITLKDINQKKETIRKVIYMYDAIQQESYYVVSETK